MVFSPQKPKVIIVNDNDEPIGAKYRNEIDPIKEAYRCSGIWIVNSKNEILLAQRAFTKSHDPGKWGPAVAGTLEEGETYESNAHKEAYEELGLTSLELETGPKQHSRSPRNFFGQWFVCRLNKSVAEFILQKEEVEQVEWVDKQKLVEDIKVRPDKYVPSLKWAVEQLARYW